ncbi:hypothetical protein GCM10029978_075860 [Actinoallomurus acanthiterrae]
MDYREFIQVTQRRGCIDGDLAERAARATPMTLAKRPSPGQACDLLEQIPAEMKPWLHPQRAAEWFDIDEFLCRVAEREGADVETTERHAHAVFYVLHGPLGHGPATSGETARRISLDRFVDRIAEPAGVDPFEAREYARAVFATLREVVRDDEYFDVTVQLPMDYHALLPEP